MEREITINQLKQEKRLIESQIQLILSNFCEKYDVEVTSFNIAHAKTIKGKNFPIAFELEISI